VFKAVLSGNLIAYNSGCNAAITPHGNVGHTAMQKLSEQPGEAHRDAAECELRANLATDPNKREIFTRLAQHLTTLAAEVECSMVAKAARDEEKN
jgi:hypothetical protein